MRHLLGVLLALASIPVLAASLACAPPRATPSGATEVGTFVVDGALQENACAPGLETLDPLRFTVTMEQLGTHASWRYGMGAPVGGTLNAAGEFRFIVQTQVEAWPADPLNGIAGCTLTQTETLTGQLEMASDRDAGPADAGPLDTSDAGVTPDAATPRDGGALAPSDAGADAGPSDLAVGLSGEQTIQIGVVSGSDCTPLLLVSGGPFPMLPCSARYAIRGARAPE